MFQPADQTIRGTITITDDNIFEPDETIPFQLSRPTNSPAELGSVRSTRVTIQDNEGKVHMHKRERERWGERGEGERALLMAVSCVEGSRH